MLSGVRLVNSENCHLGRRVMREPVILLVLASVAGCGVVPTSSESNATGVRQGVNGLEFATQLCPNETITRFTEVGQQLFEWFRIGRSPRHVKRYLM